MYSSNVYFLGLIKLVQNNLNLYYAHAPFSLFDNELFRVEMCRYQEGSSRKVWLSRGLVTKVVVIKSARHERCRFLEKLPRSVVTTFE